MKSTLLLGSALFLSLSLIVCEAAAQTCTEDAKCVVGGQKGTRPCQNGHLGKCVADPDLGEGALCGGKACASGKVCQDSQCVSSCKAGFTDCDGICRNLSHDSGNCGACGNACRSGTSCQPSAESGVCGCTPPSITCGGICRNPTNDPSNCGACGNVCTAPDTLCRNRQCVPPEVPPASGSAGSTGDLPLDLLWKTTDPNGLPFNPDWRARSDPALVFEENANVVVDVAKACPACQPDAKCAATCKQFGLSSLACISCFPKESCWRRCTQFPVTSDGGFFCSAAHINWVPATYDGTLEFDDYSARGIFGGFKDDDYTFNLTPTGGAGLAGRGKLHPEMAFLETVNHFESGFWSNFRDLVDHVSGDDLSAPKSLFAGRHAIVIGLQGLDTQHGLHEELHPIYAMALRRTENPVTGVPSLGQDCWAIFARNWGNEGFCSNHDHPRADLDHITFHLPQPAAATAVTETFRDVKTNNTALTAVSEVGRVGDGAEFTVFLGRPEDRTFVNGEVCLRWSVPPGAQPPQVAAPAPRPAPRPAVKLDLDLDEDEFPGIDLLTRAQLARLRRSFPSTPSHDRRRDMQAPKRVPFVRDLAKAQGPTVVLPDRLGRVDVQKQARERRIQSRICQMLRGHPKRPEICGQL